MVRKVIKIDESKCVGCELCAKACHEGAIGMVDGVAKLLREDYCDGLGNCLPVCPTGAITFEEREAAAFDKKAAAQNMEECESECNEEGAVEDLPCGCPGTHSRTLNREKKPSREVKPSAREEAPRSELNQWPVQIQLAPVNAPYFKGARLLIAADCAAYAYANFHADFMRGKITLIGCPKLDDVEYSEKLTEIISRNDIKSVTVVRMEVPCCGGLEHAVVAALKNSGKMIPWQVVTLSTEGEILEE